MAFEVTPFDTEEQPQLPLPYDLRQQLQQPSTSGFQVTPFQAPEPEPNLFEKILAVPGNFLSEAKNILLGLGPGLLHLGRSIINDTIGAVEEVFTLGKADTDFMLDDVGVSIANDFKERYGPLLEGDVGGFLEQLGKRPLSFVLDGLAVGGLATKGAAVASRVPSIERGLAQIASETGFAYATNTIRRGRFLRYAGDVVAQRGRVLGMSKTQFTTEYSRLAEGLSQVARPADFGEIGRWIEMHGDDLHNVQILDSLPNGVKLFNPDQLFNQRLGLQPSGLAKYVARTLPKTRSVHIPGTRQIVAVEDRVNPLVRSIVNPFRARFSIRPLDELEEGYAAARAKLEADPFSLTPAQSQRLAFEEQVITEARMDGATHYATERGSSQILTHQVRKLMGGSYGRQVIAKTERYRALERILKPVMTQVEKGTTYWKSKRVAEAFLGMNDADTTQLPGITPYDLGTGEIQLAGGQGIMTASHALYGGTNPLLITDEATDARYAAANQHLAVEQGQVGPLERLLRETFEIDDNQLLNVYRVDDPGAPLMRLKDRGSYEAKAGLIQGPPEDLLGMRVVVPGVSDFRSFANKFREVFPDAQFANHVGMPGADGYVGVKGYVKLPGDVSLEVQFVLDSGYTALRAGEPMYKAMREAVYQLMAKEAAKRERDLVIAERLKELPEGSPDAQALVAERAQLDNDLVGAALQHEMMAHRYRNLWNLSRYQVGQELLDIIPTPTDMAREQMRLYIEDTETRQLIERGVMSPQQILEHEYLAPRLLSGAKYDGTTGSFVDGASVPELLRYRDSMQLPSPIYFPTFDTRRSPNLSSMFTRHGDLQRPPRAGFQKKSKGELIRHDLEYARLQAKDISDLQETFLRDPFEAYIRHANEVIKVQEAWHIIQNLVGRYGHVLENGLKDFDPLTQSLVIPQALHTHFRSMLTFEDAIRRGLEAGFDVNDAAASALKTAFQAFDEDIQKQVIHSTVGVKTNTAYAVPRVIGERFNEYFRSAWGSLAEQNIRVFWDSPVGAWRHITLAGSPRWWVNNILGGTIFTKLEGAKLRDVLKLYWDQRKLNKGQDTYLRNQLKRLGLDDEAIVAGNYLENDTFLTQLGTQAKATIGGRVISGVEEFAAKTARTRLSPVRWLRNLRAENARWETAFREAGVIHELEQRTIKANVTRAATKATTLTERLDDIAKHGVTRELIDESSDAMLRFHGDYATLSPIERRLVRRFIAPFWSWYRHTLRLTVSMPLDDALRTEVLAAIAALDKDLQEDLGPTPEWLKGSYPITPIGPFVGTRAANPFSTPVQLITQPVSLVGPVWQILNEMSTGRISYSGREFTSPDTLKPFGSDQAFRIIRDDAGIPINVEPIDKVTPSWVEEIFSTLPQYDLIKDLIAGGARYSAPGLLAVGTIMEGDEPKWPSSRRWTAARFFGLPVYADFDIIEWQQRLAEDSASAMTQALNQSAEAQAFLDLGS